jgi:predicted dehydrogenase
MKNIMIIGAGQLGSRHLQGALLSKYALNITVVDLSKDSLKVAESRAAEVNYGNKDSKVNFSQTIESGLQVDICIIATTANVRFMVFEELVSKCTVANVIFEKVLFQTEKEYIDTEKLLISNHVNAWVNCPRRIFPAYQKIKQLLSDETNITMRMAGSNWGMACNSIHFIDLFSFVTGSADISIDFSQLDRSVVPSKRGGYYEVNGTIQGANAKGQTFELNCIESDKIESLVTFTTDNFNITVKETGGEFIIEESGKEILDKYTPLYQSQLTHINIEEIIETSQSSLTNFGDSSQLHLPFIAGIKQQIERDLGESLSRCPIT